MADSRALSFDKPMSHDTLIDLETSNARLDDPAWVVVDLSLIHI